LVKIFSRKPQGGSKFLAHAVYWFTSDKIGYQFAIHTTWCGFLVWRDFKQRTYLLTCLLTFVEYIWYDVQWV